MHLTGKTRVKGPRPSGRVQVEGFFKNPPAARASFWPCTRTCYEFTRLHSALHCKSLRVYSRAQVRTDCSHVDTLACGAIPSTLDPKGDTPHQNGEHEYIEKELGLDRAEHVEAHGSVGVVHEDLHTPVGGQRFVSMACDPLTGQQVV